MRQRADNLRKTEERYRLLAENVVDVIWTVSTDLRVTYVSPSVTLLTGYRVDEVMSLPMEQFLTPASHRVVTQTLREWMAGEASSERLDSRALELEIVRRDGTRVWTESRVRPLRGDHGEPMGVVGVSRDMTSHLAAEEALRRSEARLQEAQRIAHVGSWEWDIPAKTAYWSEETLRLLGATPRVSEDGREGVLAFVHPHDRALVSHLLDEALDRGTPWDTDLILLRADGTERLVHSVGHVVRDDKGKPVRIAGTLHDVTELKRTEAELRALSRRLVEIQEEERSRIARELHDQIGQSLAILKLSLDQALSRPQGNIEAILGQTPAIVGELIDIVRDLSVNLRPAMLDDLGLVEALIWYFESYAERTGIAVEFSHHGVAGKLDPQVSITTYRIVQEALTNVAHHAGVEVATVGMQAEGGNLVVIVEDAGVGFDPAGLAIGTTPGLDGMRERARVLDGTLIIESAPGAGTRLMASLPLHARA